MKEVIAPMIFAAGSALFLIGNLLLVWRALR